MDSGSLLTPIRVLEYHGGSWYESQSRCSKFFTDQYQQTNMETMDSPDMFFSFVNQSLWSRSKVVQQILK